MPARIGCVVTVSMRVMRHQPGPSPHRRVGRASTDVDAVRAQELEEVLYHLEAAIEEAGGIQTTA